MGSEMMLDQYLTCGGSCERSCTQKTHMLTGMCTDADGTGTQCKECTGSCRMDMTFSTTLYLTKADFTAAKTNLFLEALNVTMSVPMPDISIVSTTESATAMVASKTIVVVTKISLRSGDSGTTSATPGFTFSELKAQLITNGFTSKIAGTGLPGAGLSDTDRFGTHFTDKGTVLDINKVFYRFQGPNL